MKLFAPILKLLGKILACLERIERKMPILDDVNALEQAEVALETGVNKLLADKQDADKRASDAEAKAADLQAQLDAAKQAQADAESKAADLQAKADADAQNNTQAEQQIQALNDKLTALENLVSPPAASAPEQPAPDQVPPPDLSAPVTAMPVPPEMADAGQQPPDLSAVHDTPTANDIVQAATA